MKKYRLNNYKPFQLNNFSLLLIYLFLIEFFFILFIISIIFLIFFINKLYFKFWKSFLLNGFIIKKTYIFLKSFKL